MKMLTEISYIFTRETLRRSFSRTRAELRMHAPTLWTVLSWIWLCRIWLPTSTELKVSKSIVWFKPAFDDHGSALEHKKLHICSLAPATTMTAAHMAMRYNGSRPELPCVFSTSGVEGLSNGDGLGPVETQGEDLC